MDRKSIVFIATILISAPGGSQGAGNHLGWCNGVGNPHDAATCSGGSTPQTVPHPGDIPVSNQMPGTNVGPGPVPGSTTAIVTIAPEPQRTITGTGPVTPVAGQPGPSITGTGQMPFVLQPIPQTVFTGVSPVPQVQAIPAPSFTGVGRPTIVIQPLPPATFTGVSPTGDVRPLPTPSFTGQPAPMIIVVPNPPTTTTGFGPVPVSIIVQAAPGPSFTGRSPVPQRAPQAMPIAIPGPTPQATPMMRPKPRPQPAALAAGPGSIIHEKTRPRRAVGEAHITRTSGRQSAHDAPRFASGDGRTWDCVASGHGKRRSMVDGEVASSGALRHVGAVDVLGRDLPALHPERAGCLISVRRRAD